MQGVWALCTLLFQYNQQHIMQLENIRLQPVPDENSKVADFIKKCYELIFDISSEI